MNEETIPNQENALNTEELRERKRVVFFGLPLSFTRYVLQEKKLIVHTGFFTSVEDEVLLYRIMDVSLRRTLGQKLFGLGTLRVASSDKSMSDFEIKNIRHYREFKDALSDRVAAERLRMRTRTSEMMGVEFDGSDMDGDDRDDLQF